MTSAEESPILDEAMAAAQRADCVLAPEVVQYLLSKTPRGYRLTAAPGRDEGTMRRNAAHLILEAAALTGRAPGAELQLATVKSALAGLCQRYPDFWPFCPP